MHDDYYNEPIDLSQYDEEYESAEVPDTNYDELPDGKYQVFVERVEMTRSKEKGHPMLKWQLRIIGPTHANQCLFRNNMIITQENIKWLKGDLEICGLELSKLSDLEANLDKLLDVKLEVTQKTRGEYSNVYFNRRIVTEDAPSNSGDEPGESGAPQDGGSKLTDDIPVF